MERIKVISTINNIQYSQTQANTAYEEFLRFKPIYEDLQEDWSTMFKDAVTSFLYNYEAVNKTGLLRYDKMDHIVEKANQYAIIYFNSGKKDRVLYIFRGVLNDIIRDCNYSQDNYLNMTNFIFEKIKELITV